MIKTLITAGAYTSGNVPMTLSLNTNQKYNLLSNAVQIRSAGLNNVIANVIVEAIGAGALSLQLYADGVAVPGAIDTQTVTAGEYFTFHINDVVKTIYQSVQSFSELALAFSSDCTLVSGDMVVEYVR